MSDNKTFGWSEQFAKEGFSIFNEKSVKLFRQMQIKYTDFHSFFDKLSSLYQGQRMTAEQEKAGKSIALVEDIVSQIDKLLDAKTTPSAKEVDSLFNLTNELDENIKFFRGQGIEKLSFAMQKRIEEAESKTGISLDRLGKSAELMMAKTRTVGRTKQEQFQKQHPLMAETMKGLGGIGAGVAGAMLGPLGGIATKAFDLYRKQRQKKITVGNMAAASDLSLESEQSSESLRKTHDRLFAGGKDPIPETVAEKSRTITEGLARSQKALPQISKDQGGMVKTTSVGLGNALFSFFQNDAYRTKWTKDLMDVLNKIAGTKGKEQVGTTASAGIGSSLLAGGIGGLLTKLGPMLANAAPILAGIAGLGMGVWDAFKAQKTAKDKGWLGKPGEELHGGQKIAAGVGGVLGGTGPGVGEKGVSVGDVAKNALWGTIKGAAIGFMVGGPIGAAVGAGVGLSGGLIGGKRIAQGLQNATRAVTGTLEKAKTKPDDEILNPIRPENLDVIHVRKSAEELSSLNIEGSNKLTEAIDRLTGKLGQSAKTGNGTSSGNFQATTIGDPMIESLSMGTLDVE